MYRHHTILLAVRLIYCLSVVCVWLTTESGTRYIIGPSTLWRGFLVYDKYNLKLCTKYNSLFYV